MYSQVFIEKRKTKFEAGIAGREQNVTGWQKWQAKATAKSGRVAWRRFALRRGSPTRPKSQCFASPPLYPSFPLFPLDVHHCKSRLTFTTLNKFKWIYDVGHIRKTFSRFSRRIGKGYATVNFQRKFDYK